MLDKVLRVLKAIEYITKDENDDLRALLVDYPDAEDIIKYVGDYETKINALLVAERDYFIQSMQQYMFNPDPDAPVTGAIYDISIGTIQADDKFPVAIVAESKAFLSVAVTDLSKKLMDSIDPDITLKVLSNRTLKWIENWSEDLGKLMTLTSHKAVERVLLEGIGEAKSMQYIVLDLMDLPEFNRTRARATAITEVLTASSVSQQEAYMQSPAVVGKEWLHSGSAKNKPRPHHVAMHGTVVPKDDYFYISGNIACEYPRDTMLPASERIHCHCTTVPKVDEDILGISAAEKELIRDQVLAELE